MQMSNESGRLLTLSCMAPPLDMEALLELRTHPLALGTRLGRHPPLYRQLEIMLLVSFSLSTSLLV